MKLESSLRLLYPKPERWGNTACHAAFSAHSSGLLSITFKTDNVFQKDLWYNYSILEHQNEDLQRKMKLVHVIKLLTTNWFVFQKHEFVR